MSEDEIPLFTLTAEEPAVQVERHISDEQVSELRRAFNDAEMFDSEERAELVRSCVIRPISSLRDLFPRDVRPILRRIQERSQIQRPAGGNAWDNREEDTWIDKL